MSVYKSLPNPYLLTNYTSWLTPHIPLAIASHDEGETFCLKVSVELRPHLLGLIETACWLDKWQGTQDDKLRSVGVMVDLQRAIMIGDDCMLDDCCDPVVSKLDELNKTATALYNLLKRGAIIRFGDFETPNDYIPACAIVDFDKGEGEVEIPVLLDREKALCLTVARFITAVLWRYGKSMNFSTQTKSDILSLMDIDAPPDFYPQITKGNEQEFDLGRLSRIAGADTVAFELVVCEWISGLEGKQNTFANFKSSLVANAPDTYPNVETSWLTQLIVAVIQERENYNVFSGELENSYTDVTVNNDPYVCPCSEPIVENCEFPIELTADFKGTIGESIVFEQMPDGVWHITNNTTYQTSPDIRYLGAFRDAHGQCMKAVTIPDTYPASQGIIEHDLHGCCGVPDHTGQGGFTTDGILDVSWSVSEPLDLYIGLVCVTPEECE